MNQFCCGFTMPQDQKSNKHKQTNEWDNKQPTISSSSHNLINFSDDEDHVEETTTSSSSHHNSMESLNEDNCFKDESSALNISDYDGDCEDNDDPKAINDKCAICLTPQIGDQNRAYVSTCFHKFCFNCLLEWYKVHPTCPLCKRSFDRIVYECRSNTDFKEYYLVNSNNQQTPPGSPDSGYNTISTTTEWNKASWIVGKQCAPVLFRALVYANEWYVDPTLTQIHIAKKHHHHYHEDSKQPVVIQYSSQAFMNQERFRTLLASPQWYREHEPLLMSWLARELCALALVANNSDNQLKHLDNLLLMDLLDKLVKLLLLQLLDKLVYDESDLSVVASVAELLHLPKRVARHFVHELTFFVAASPSHDMVEYDSQAVYFERHKAMRRRHFLSAGMLPVNVTSYRLVPPSPSVPLSSSNEHHMRMPIQFGVDMARNFVAAVLNKDEYVKRILMLNDNGSDDNEAEHHDDDNCCDELMIDMMSLDPQQQQQHHPHAIKRGHDEIEMCSDDSVASSSSLMEDDESSSSSMIMTFEMSSDDGEVKAIAEQVPPPVPPSSPASNNPTKRPRRMSDSDRTLLIERKGYKRF